MQIFEYYQDHVFKPLQKLGTVRLDTLINTRLNEFILNYLMSNPIMDTASITTDLLADKFEEFLVRFEASFIDFHSVTFDLFHNQLGLNDSFKISCNLLMLQP